MPGARLGSRSLTVLQTPLPVGAKLQWRRSLREVVPDVCFVWVGYRGPMTMLVYRVRGGRGRGHHHSTSSSSSSSSVLNLKLSLPHLRGHVIPSRYNVIQPFRDHVIPQEVSRDS